MDRPGSLRYEAKVRGVSVSRVRTERGVARGLSPRAARGHPRGDEPSAADLRKVARAPSRATMPELRRAAVARARALLGDLPRFDLERVTEHVDRLVGTSGRRILRKMVDADEDEWRQRASGPGGAPWHYH